MLMCGSEAIPVRTMADMITRNYCTMDVSLIYSCHMVVRCKAKNFIWFLRKWKKNR